LLTSLVFARPPRKTRFHDPEIDSIRADELAGDYPAIQYVPPTGDFWIDTVRPQDRLDAQALRERFDLPEE